MKNLRISAGLFINAINSPISAFHKIFNELMESYSRYWAYSLVYEFIFLLFYWATKEFLYGNSDDKDKKLFIYVVILFLYSFILALFLQANLAVSI